MGFGEQMLMLLCNEGLWACVILQSVGSKPERPLLTQDSIKDNTQLLNRGNFIFPSLNSPEVNVPTLAEFLCSVKLSRNMTCQISIKPSRKVVISFTRVYNLTRWEPLFFSMWLVRVINRLSVEVYLYTNRVHLNWQHVSIFDIAESALIKWFHLKNFT